MGLNSYGSYDKEAVDKYTTLLNNQRATPAEKKLRAQTEALGDTMKPMPDVIGQEISRMEVEIGEARRLTMMTRDLGRQHDRPMKALDIGTFTGHSAGAIAKGMELGGKVVTVDISDKYKPLAEEYWKDEGVRERIDYRIEPVGDGNGGARKVMADLVSDPKELNSYDIVFIDADKVGYDHYYEQALKLLRPGGKILLDNMLWSGRAVNPEAFENPHDKDASAHAVHDLNAKIINDPRVDAILDNSDDGIMVVEKLGFARKVHKEAEFKKQSPGSVMRS